MRARLLIVLDYTIVVHYYRVYYRRLFLDQLFFTCRAIIVCTKMKGDTKYLSVFLQITTVPIPQYVSQVLSGILELLALLSGCSSGFSKSRVAKLRKGQ